MASVEAIDFTAEQFNYPPPTDAAQTPSWIFHDDNPGRTYGTATWAGLVLALNEGDTKSLVKGTSAARDIAGTIGVVSTAIGFSVPVSAITTLLAGYFMLEGNLVQNS